MKFSKLILAGFITISFAAQAQVGIGTNSPAASAQLEVSSSSKGFLPPRMTYAQREAITNPAVGLMIYCTNCGANGEWQGYNGNAWANISGAAASSVIPQIGDTYLGGKLAYILQVDDPGYSATVTHGLIAATSDQSTSMQWYNGSDVVTGATGTDIGTGLANTNAIITAQGTGSYAAKLSRDYNGGGFTDWYLPSKDELNKLYINRIAIGGFTDRFYWSSTESSNVQNAWIQYFDGTGTQQTFWRSYPTNVRAVRSF